MATPKTKSSPLHDFVAKIASTSMPYPHPNDPTVQIFIRPLSFILLPQQNLLRDQGASSLLHTQSLLMSIDLDACFERPISARFCKCLHANLNLMVLCHHPNHLVLAKPMPLPCWMGIAIHGISAAFVGKQVLAVGFASQHGLRRSMF